MRHGTREGQGSTENLSDRGAMVSLELDPPASSGTRLQLEIDIPGMGPILVAATVRWVSAVLPGMIGIEFDPPIPPELTIHIQGLKQQQAQTGT